MKIIAFFTLLLISLIACKTGGGTIADGQNLFGEKFVPKKVISIDDVYQQLTTQDTVVTQLEGTVESVCKKKGCWMNLKPTVDSENEIFVKFKDYGFFMPLDCEGKTVIMNGKAFKEITSVDELRHYAEDEGKSAEEIAKITEPMEEYKFLADGVIMK